MEYSNNHLDFEVYVLTHPDLLVDYRFKADGNSSSVAYDILTDSVISDIARMSLIYNTSNGTGNAYPRPMWSSRYVSSDKIKVQRRRAGQN